MCRASRLEIEFRSVVEARNELSPKMQQGPFFDNNRVKFKPFALHSRNTRNCLFNARNDDSTYLQSRYIDLAELCSLAICVFGSVVRQSFDSNTNRFTYEFGD